MQVVRIDRKGWDKFTGQLGFVDFVDGVSTRPLTDREVQQIGASIRIVAIDTDRQVGQGVTIQQGHNLAAEVKAPLKKMSEVQKMVAPVELKYDRDRLDEIASEGGIKAIREIAAEYNVKGVQISTMIDEIIEAQKEGARE